MEKQDVVLPKLWTKSFLLICLSNLFIFTSFYCLLPTLPLFITNVLKGDTKIVGYIFGVFALAAVLARPLAGYLLDAVGRKNILRLSLFLLTLAMIAYNMVTNLLLLFILRGIHGILWGFATTASGTTATDLVPALRRGEGIGYYGLSNTIAMAAGPFIGLEIVQRFGFSTLFTISFCFAAIGFLCIWGIQHQITEKLEVKKSIVLFEPKVISDAVITFFITLLYGGVLSFVVLFGKEIHIDNPGSYFLAFAGALFLSRPYAGRILDAEGPIRIMFIGFISLALSFLVLSFAQGYVLFILSALFFGIGFGIVQPTTLTMAINKVGASQRGIANGTILTAFDLGVGCGSIVLGILSNYFGLPKMYLISCFVVLIPFLIFYAKYVSESRHGK